MCSPNICSLTCAPRLSLAAGHTWPHLLGWVATQQDVLGFQVTVHLGCTQQPLMNHPQACLLGHTFGGQVVLLWRLSDLPVYFIQLWLNAANLECLNLQLAMVDLSNPFCDPLDRHGDKSSGLSLLTSRDLVPVQVSKRQGHVGKIPGSPNNGPRLEACKWVEPVYPHYMSTQLWIKYIIMYNQMLMPIF